MHSLKLLTFVVMAIAHQVFDGEKKYLEVKKLMRDMVLKNQDMYRNCFDVYFKIDECITAICSGLEKVVGSNVVVPEEIGLRKWFMSPECSQVAACTFQRPVACYSNESSKGYASTFLPVLKNKDVFPNSGLSPLPIVMQNVSNSHWVTLKMKRSIKIKWPIVNIYHSNATKLAGFSDDKIKSFWNRHLTFKKYVPSEQTGKYNIHIILFKSTNPFYF